jgi:hypothetical protein
MEKTFMYAWTVEHWSVHDGIYVKIGRTDDLARRKNNAQTYHATPLQLISIIEYPKDKKHEWDTKLKNHLMTQRVTLGGGTEIFKFASRDDVVKLFETLCLWSSDDTRNIPVDAFDDTWKLADDDDETESIAETEVPSPSDDECDGVDYDLKNVPCLMKKFGIDKVWKSSHVLAVEHARDFGGIRGIDGKIMYGGSDELRGVRLDPTSRESCQLYLRVRKRYYDNRDTYGRGYLNTALTTFIKIHDSLNKEPCKK